MNKRNTDTDTIFMTPIRDEGGHKFLRFHLVSLSVYTSLTYVGGCEVSVLMS